MRFYSLQKGAAASQIGTALTSTAAVAYAFDNDAALGGFLTYELEGDAAIDVDGVLLAGMVYQAGALDVHTPTPEGNNYSVVLVHHVTWSGCVSLHIWAFSDEDHDGRRDAELAAKLNAECVGGPRHHDLCRCPENS